MAARIVGPQAPRGHRVSKTPVIIDTDPGIDDAVALAVAVTAPELDVRLVTTVGGNVSLAHTTDNALKLLEFLGAQVPVAAGAERPLLAEPLDAAAVHGESGLEGWDFPAPGRALLSEKTAVEAMRDVLLAAEEPVTLVCLAPLTNVALLLKVFPQVAEKIGRIVLMGGTAGRGNKGVLSEFNVACDPEAAAIVFQSGLPIAMAGLDVGQAATLRREDCEAIRDQNETGRMLYSLFEHYRGGSLASGLRMYDAHALAYLLEPGMYDAREAHVAIELAGSMTRGCSLVDLRGYLGRPNNATVCLGVDAARFRAWLVGALARCR